MSTYLYDIVIMCLIYSSNGVFKELVAPLPKQFAISHISV